MNQRLFGIFLTLFIVCSAAAQEHNDSTTIQTKRDSIVHAIPIPSIGSVHPFDSTLQTISARQIIWEEYRSLYDILSVQHGIVVRDLASPGQQNQISIGGLTDRNMAILIDGIPYNDFYTGTLNEWLIPVEAIERIELMGNSQSVFYDGRSGAGAVNIITKSYDNNRAITNLRYSQGVSGYTHTDAFFAQNVMREVNLTLGLSHYGYGSNKESQNYRGRFFNSNDDAWIFRSKMRYNAAAWINFSFSYLYNKTWTGLHGGVDYNTSPSIFDGLSAYVENEESYEKYSNSHYTLSTALFPFADSTFLTTVSFYHFDRLREYRDEENRSVIRNNIFTQRNFNSITNGVKLQLFSRIGFNAINAYSNYEEVKSNRILTVGVKDDIALVPFLTLSPFVVTRDFSGNQLIHTGAEARIRVTSSLALFGGITKDISNDRAVKVNTITNLTLLNPASLQNRESFSIMEIGGSISIPSFFNGLASYRRTVLKNPIVFDTIPLTSSFLFTIPLQYTYDAVSISAHLIMGEFHLEGTANYLNQPVFIHNNKSLTLFPDITLYGGAYYHGLLAKGNLDLKVGLRGRYYSRQTGMKPYDEIGVWIPSSLVEYGPSGAMDFFAIGKIGSAYVHFIWQNLTGTQYLLAPVYPMYDSNIRFGLSWEFLD
jgi:hypothetical protein